MIVERGGEFCVIGESGHNFGCYESRSQAEARLEQIKRFRDELSGGDRSPKVDLRSKDKDKSS